MTTYYFLHRKPLESEQYQIEQIKNTFLRFLFNKTNKIVFKSANRNDAVQKLKQLNHYGEDSIIVGATEEYSEYEIVSKGVE